MATPAPASAPKPVDKVREFRKGIKHDATVFPELTSDGSWHSWNDITIIQAHAQGVENVLDAKYTPNTKEDKDLFAEQQRNS